jgi:hypothetical protein
LFVAGEGIIAACKIAGGHAFHITFHHFKQPISRAPYLDNGASDPQSVLVKIEVLIEPEGAP